TIARALDRGRLHLGLQLLGGRQLGELEYPTEMLHRLLAEVLILDFQELLRVHCPAGCVNRAHLNAPLDAGQSGKRSIGAFPGRLIFWGEKSGAPTLRPVPPIPEVDVEQRARYCPAIADDVNELGVFEDLVQEPHPGPAGDLDKEPVPRRR